jgi:hypothetical protein
MMPGKLPKDNAKFKVTLKICWVSLTQPSPKEWALKRSLKKGV